MTIFDCESRDSALNSVASCYDISTNEIEDFFLSVVLDEYYEDIYEPPPPDEVITHLFEQKFSDIINFPSKVYWFHITRTWSGNNYKDGLLPLSLSLDRIWEHILFIFSNTHHYNNLIELMNTNNIDHLYNMKANDTFHSGPYAMLIIDVAFHSSELGNHNYLKLPEIIEDICNGYREHYGQDIKQQVINSLSPCIVKFWSANMSNNNILETAIYYLYLTARKEKLSIYANTTFDAKNTLIPSYRIVKVEFLSD